MSLAFALLFGSGGLMVFFTLLLPHSSDRNLAGLIGPALAAMGVAAAMLAVGRRCPIWGFRALPLWGGVLVSVVSYSGGETAVSDYAMFYFWVILSAFYFFPGRWGLANLALVGLQYALVARESGAANAELKWVMLMDLDGLKAVNDVEGHEGGDRLIRRATAGWSSALRETDFVARLGGDEFGALLPDCPEELALDVLERMREATPSVAWSAGVAVWDGEEHAGALVRRADALLYDAKRGGRNRAAADPATG